MTNNSEFLYHKPCPNCGSKDNLGVYTDHEYCFGCGYTTGRRVTKITKQSNSSLCLPDDSDTYIPSVALDWVNQYGLTVNELRANRILYSESRQLLVFPYFGEDDKQLLGWQGRYFGDNPNHPKWFTKGYIKDFIKVINLTKAHELGIIFVEDIVSAIKLGRIYGACPIFGSSIPNTHPIRLSKLGVTNFFIWLDKDKEKESRKFSVKFNGMGLPTKVISTDLDPKCYNTDELRRIIESQTTNTTTTT